jgi:hypothetical protein
MKTKHAPMLIQHIKLLMHNNIAIKQEMFHLFLFTNLDLILLQKVSSHFVVQQAFNFSYWGLLRGTSIVLLKGFNSKNL